MSCVNLKEGVRKIDSIKKLKLPILILLIFLYGCSVSSLTITFDEEIVVGETYTQEHLIRDCDRYAKCHLLYREYPSVHRYCCYVLDGEMSIRRVRYRGMV